MLTPLSASQTLERARALMASGRGAALPELLKLIETLSLNLAEVTVPELAEIIEKDAVVLTRVIAVANTIANNPGIAPLATLSQAIHQIGYNRIRTIAVSLMLLETAGTSSTAEQREAAATALGAGLVAQGLAHTLGTHDPELVFACTALRQLGRILMAAVSPEHFREAFARSRFVPDAEAHRPLFGLTPVELSRRLLTSSRLPEAVVSSLRECEPESLTGVATTHDARLLGLADFGGRLAALVLDAREGPDAFKRKSTDLARRYDKLVPGAADLAKPALLHADQRLMSFTRCNGGRALPTMSLGRFRVRVRDLIPAGTRAAEDEIETLHPEAHAFSDARAFSAAPPFLTAPALRPTVTATSVAPSIITAPVEPTPTAKPPPLPPLSVFETLAPVSPSPVIALASPPPSLEPFPPPLPLLVAGPTPSSVPPFPFAVEASPPLPGAWERGLLDSALFHTQPLDSASPPAHPWLSALTAARDLAKADEGWIFLPAAEDETTFALAHRALADGSLAPRAAAPLQATDRTIFGVSLSRHDIVVIHDTRDRTIAPYLPPWWQALAHPPGAFALVPVRDGPLVRALLLIGWPTPRRVKLTAPQAAFLDQLVRSALPQTATAAA